MNQLPNSNLPPAQSMPQQTAATQPTPQTQSGTAPAPTTPVTPRIPIAPRASITTTPFAKHDKLGADEAQDNWLAWKTRTIMILRHKQIYGVVTGEETKPAGPKTDPAVMDWMDRDLAAMDQILVGLANTEVNHAVNCYTAADVWTTLCTIHESTVQIGQFLISMLWQKRATKDTDITDHLNELTHTRNILASQGKHVFNADFKDVMLETLSHSWNPFVSSLLAQATTRSLTVNKVRLGV